MSSPDRHQICPRCGADAQGAAWCPQCGRNLRLTPAAEQAHGHAQEHEQTQEREQQAPPPPPRPRVPPPPPPPPPERDTWKIVAAALVAVVVAGGVVALAVTGHHDKTSTITTEVSVPTGTTGTTGITETTDTSTTAPSEPAANVSTTVTSQDIANVLVAYQQAYSNQDIDALSSLFADTLTRDDGSGGTEDLQQSLQTYQSQFDQLSNPQYQLSGMQFQGGDGEGFATGRYTISSDAGSVSGSIDFHLTVVDGRLLIDQISITPS